MRWFDWVLLLIAVACFIAALVVAFLHSIGEEDNEGYAKPSA